jgi:NAD(P)-dependent dehydrogenase (short-subunit alcohol dehydrogenase family)
MSQSPRAQTPADGLAWITGASTGIGRAVAEELARRGWTVAVSARSADKLDELAAAWPGRIIVAPCDVTDAAAVAALVAGLEAAHGRIALTFLNAGISIPIKTPDIDLRAVRRIIDLNVLGVFNCLAALLPAMSARGTGQVAICASIAGYGGLPNASAYCASKAAMISTAQSVAIEMRGRGVLVQVVNPGFVDTPLTAKNDFPMPFLMAPEQAARRCCDGFQRGGFEITFPRRFAFMLKVLNALPYGAYVRLLAFALSRAPSRMSR